MSLSAREQQALDSIEDRLAGSDPKLASLLATFTRLPFGLLSLGLTTHCPG